MAESNSHTAPLEPLGKDYDYVLPGLSPVQSRESSPVKPAKSRSSSSDSSRSRSRSKSASRKSSSASPKKKSVSPTGSGLRQRDDEDKGHSKEVAPVKDSQQCPNPASAIANKLLKIASKSISRTPSSSPEKSRKSPTRKKSRSKSASPRRRHRRHSTRSRSRHRKRSHRSPHRRRRSRDKKSSRHRRRRSKSASKERSRARNKKPRRSRSREKSESLTKSRETYDRSKSPKVEKSLKRAASPESDGREMPTLSPQAPFGANDTKSKNANRKRTLSSETSRSDDDKTMRNRSASGDNQKPGGDSSVVKSKWDDNSVKNVDVEAKSESSKTEQSQSKDRSKSRENSSEKDKSLSRERSESIDRAKTTKASKEMSKERTKSRERSNTRRRSRSKESRRIRKRSHGREHSKERRKSRSKERSRDNNRMRKERPQRRSSSRDKRRSRSRDRKRNFRSRRSRSGSRPRHYRRNILGGDIAGRNRRSGSRSRSPQQPHPKTFRQKLKAQLFKSNKTASTFDEVNKMELGENLPPPEGPKEKPSNLPLVQLDSCIMEKLKNMPAGQVMSQLALMQQMTEMREKAQQITGVAVPKYYNQAAVNPLKYAETIKKRKMLWSKKPEQVEEVPKDQWKGTAFAADDSGQVAAKFRKLMGIKEDDAVDEKAMEEQQRKRAEMFQRLDQDYAFARMTTHTQRGVGLGFQKQACIDPNVPRTQAAGTSAASTIVTSSNTNT